MFYIADLNNTYLQSNEINSLTMSSFYSNLYGITSDNITVNSLNSNLFYSTRGQIDILTNSTARMSDVYSDNLYNNNDVYSKNIRTLNFVSISNLVQFNDNITLPYPFVTPSIGQLGYQISGTIISNATTITSNTLYTISSINIDAGVWMIFGQIGWKCSGITTSPIISSNTMGIGLTASIGVNVIEKRETYSVAIKYNIYSKILLYTNFNNYRRLLYKQ